MLNLGLKLWSINDCYFEEAKRLVAEQVCQYIELYVVPETLRQWGSLWKSIDIPYVIHAPHFIHGMNLARKESTDSNRQLAEESFAFADLLQAEHLIFHPGISGEDSETIRQLNSWPHEWKKRILIENKPYRTITESPLVCNGHSPEQIREIVKQTGVGFCFDIGHGICSANSRQVNYWDEIASYENLDPTMYHLSDNDSCSDIDAHLNLGKGDYPLEKIFESIVSSKRISLETQKKKTDSLADFEQDVFRCEDFLYRLTFSLATEKDSKEIFDLANDPVVRKNSIHVKTIPWESHQTWFNDKLNSFDTVFYLVRNKQDSLCGYIRYDFDCQKGYWVCSVAISPRFRGQGLATFFLKRTKKLLRQKHAEPLYAWIKEENVPSIKAFQKAGYHFFEQVQLHGVTFSIYRII